MERVAGPVVVPSTYRSQSDDNDPVSYSRPNYECPDSEDEASSAEPADRWNPIQSYHPNMSVQTARKRQ